MIWILSKPMRDRIADLRAGPRSLIAAIEAADQELVLVPVKENVSDFSAVRSIKESEGVFVYGDTSFLRQAKEAREDFMRGIFFDERAVSHSSVSKLLGDMCLNKNGVLINKQAALAALVAGDKVFLRPDASNKAFAGRVFKPEDYSKASDLPDVPIIMAPVQPIVAEYRFVVIDGRVITGSQYKRGSMDIRMDYDLECAKFAQQAADIYAPIPCFVCDVAQTDTGPKVIEYNSLSPAGLYHCDGRLIVQAVSEHFEPQSK